MKTRFWLLLCLVACEPSLPGLTSSADPASCAGCHASQAAGWAESAHAASGESPVFVALVDKTRESWGPDAAARCVSCHQPGHGDQHAITCVSCHGAVANRGVGDGKLVVDLSAPLAGISADAANPAHGTRVRPLLRSPDLCGTCHEVTGPRLLSEPTLSEFRASGAQDSGTTCLTCHFQGHRFVGFSPELLRDGLALQVERRGEALEIALTNVGAAHNIPTGATFLRRIWVEVRQPDGLTSVPVELGSTVQHEGSDVALFTDGDAARHSALAPGETVTRSVVAMEGSTVHLLARRIRRDVLDQLDLSRLLQPPVPVAQWSD